MHISKDKTNRRRRDVLKGIGVVGGVSVFGLGSVQAREQDESVPSQKVTELLNREESRAALETADVERPNPTAAKRIDISGPRQSAEEWITAPAGEDATFGYNTDENIAEIVLDSESVVRARAHDDDMIVEDLELGEDVTEDALETLKSSDDFDEALNDASVTDLKTDEAAANFDNESGVTRAFVPAERRDGDSVMLLAEIDEDGSLNAVYGLPTAPEDGVSVQDDGIECWIGCISFGLLCSNVCVPCASAPTPYTCAPCAVCVGASAAIACSRECSIPQFW